MNHLDSNVVFNICIPRLPSDEMSEDYIMAYSISPTRNQESTKEKKHLWM